MRLLLPPTFADKLNHRSAVAPAAAPPAVLPATIELSNATPRAAPLIGATPPPDPADLLAVIVQLRMSSVPGRLSTALMTIAPPLALAELPEIVLLVMVSP